MGERRHRRRPQNRRQPEQEEQLGGFSVGGRNRRPKLRKLARRAAMAVLACAALWSAVRLVGFGARYVQTRRLEAQLSAAHGVNADEPAEETPLPAPPQPSAQTANPTRAPSAEPTAAPAKDFIARLNPDSLKVIRGFAEPYLAQANVGDDFQFLRMGYFCKDKDSTADLAVFNRVVPLKDSYKPE